MINIRVLFFASLARKFGAAERSLELPDGADVAAALMEMQKHYPELEALRGRIAVAVNCEYADNRRPLCDGDELALLPPVSGG